MSGVVVVTLTTEELSRLVRDAVAAELDARALKTPEAEPEIFESLATFMETRMNLSVRAGHDWKKRGLLVCIGEGRSLRVDVKRTLEKIRASKKRPDTAVEDLARRAARRSAA